MKQIPKKTQISQINFLKQRNGIDFHQAVTESYYVFFLKKWQNDLIDEFCQNKESNNTDPMQTSLEIEEE